MKPKFFICLSSKWVVCRLSDGFIFKQEPVPGSPTSPAGSAGVPGSMCVCVRAHAHASACACVREFTRVPGLRTQFKLRLALLSLGRASVLRQLNNYK